MKDVLGRQLTEGCDVLFLLQTGSQRSSKGLHPGVVLRVEATWVEVGYDSLHIPGEKSKTKRFGNLVLVTKEMRARV